MGYISHKTHGKCFSTQGGNQWKFSWNFGEVSENSSITTALQFSQCDISNSLGNPRNDQ